MIRSKHISNTNPKPRTPHAPMSLATRCTECKTIFRVMEDQLRVSEGWVRCGRCGSVFNGLASLLQLKRDPLHEAALRSTVSQPEEEQQQQQASNQTEPALIASHALEAEVHDSPSSETPYTEERDLSAVKQDSAHERDGNEARSWPQQADAALTSPAALPSEITASELQTWNPTDADNWIAETLAGTLDESALPLPHTLLKKLDASEPPAPQPPRASFRQALAKLDRPQPHGSGPAFSQERSAKSRSRKKSSSASHDRPDAEATGFLAPWADAQGPVTELVPPPLDQHVPTVQRASTAEDTPQKQRPSKSSKSRRRKSTQSSLVSEADPSPTPLIESEQIAAGLHRQPSFVRRAQSQARWRNKRVRAALLTSSLLLSVTLSLQMLVHWRDAAAARWPQTQAWLTQTCSLFSAEPSACEIQAPKRIAQVSVESSSLVQVDAPNTYQLSITLRNRSTETLTLPSLELNITNANNQLIARRALNPSQFRAETENLPGSAEMALSLFFKSDVQAVSGYTVEAFYP